MKDNNSKTDLLAIDDIGDKLGDLIEWAIRNQERQ